MKARAGDQGSGWGFGVFSYEAWDPNLRFKYKVRDSDLGSARRIRDLDSWSRPRDRCHPE